MTSKLDNMRADMNAEAYGVRSRIDKIRDHMLEASAKDIHSAAPSVVSAPITPSVSSAPIAIIAPIATIAPIASITTITTIAPPTEGPPSYRDLITSNVLTVGDRVFYIQRKGTRFYGDLLPDGRIRYSAGQTPSFEDLYFLSPTAFNNFCARMADPAYLRGNGFVYTFYKRNEDKMWVSLAEIRRLTFDKKAKDEDD
jgi:hypothetical protein